MLNHVHQGWPGYPSRPPDVPSHPWESESTPLSFHAWMQLGRTDGAQLLSAPAIDLGQQGKSGSSFPMGMGGIWAKKQSSGDADFSRSPVVLVSGRHAPHCLWLEKVRRSP